MGPGLVLCGGSKHRNKAVGAAGAAASADGDATPPVTWPVALTYVEQEYVCASALESGFAASDILSRALMAHFGKRGTTPASLHGSTLLYTCQVAASKMPIVRKGHIFKCPVCPRNENGISNFIGGHRSNASLLCIVVSSRCCAGVGGSPAALRSAGHRSFLLRRLLPRGNAVVTQLA